MRFFNTFPLCVSNLPQRTYSAVARMEFHCEPVELILTNIMTDPVELILTNIMTEDSKGEVKYVCMST